MLAAGIVMGWVGSWLLLLPTSLDKLPPTLVIAAVLLRTLMQTGLFIVAHDAMHGTLWPSRPENNRRIGAFALFLYAALPYDHCRHNHLLHHRHAGTSLDPDHHAAGHGSLWAWYVKFMAAYLSPRQLTLLVASWLILFGLSVPFTSSPVANAVVYGILPVLLSSAQLFLVGTFLPHGNCQMSVDGASGAHQPRSLDLPGWLSLLACFHFGYHLEHHTFPSLAWHELPSAKSHFKNQF